MKAVGVEEESRSFESIVKDADFVVQGTVRQLSAYLSEDETLIYTDYELTPVAIISDAPNEHSVARPPFRTFTVKQLGGKINLGGVEVTVVNERMGPLPLGDSLVLFLQRSDEGTKHQIVGEHWGAFVVKGGAVFPLMKRADLHERPFGVGLSQFYEEVRGLRQQ